MSSSTSPGVLPGFAFLNEKFDRPAARDFLKRVAVMDDPARRMVASIAVDGDIVSQKLDICGTVSYRFANLAADQLDKAIYVHLVKLGWTPPTNNKTGS